MSRQGHATHARRIDLDNIDTCIALLHGTSSIQVCEQLPAIHVVEDEVELRVRLKGVVKVDEERRLLDRGENTALSLGVLLGFPVCLRSENGGGGGAVRTSTTSLKSGAYQRPQATGWALVLCRRQGEGRWKT